MKAVSKFLMVVAVIMGFVVKSQAATVSLSVTGRLLEANCNSITGLADVALAVYEERNNTMTIRKYNLVNEYLCSKNTQLFGQRLTDMAFSSVMGAGMDGSEYIRLHKITFNIQGIGYSLTEVVVDNRKLMMTYRKFRLFDYPNYKVYDQRAMASEGSHNNPEGARHVIDLSRQRP